MHVPGMEGLGRVAYLERNVFVVSPIVLFDIAAVHRTYRANSIVGHTIRKQADAKGENYLQNGRNSQ